FVFDAERCNARVVSGCAAPAGSFRVGPDAGYSGLAVDSAARALYIGYADNVVSAVDTRRCRAKDTTGCQRHWPTLQTGNAPSWIVDDPATSTLFVLTGLDQQVLALDIAACNGLRTAGCRDEAPAVTVQEDVVVVVNPAKHTVYVTNANFHKLAMFDMRT